MKRKTIVILGVIALLIVLVLGLTAATAYYVDLPNHVSNHETIVLGQSRYVPGSQAALRVVVRDTKDASPLEGAKIKASLKAPSPRGGKQGRLFPAEVTPPAGILIPSAAKGTKTLVNKVPGGNDNFRSEVYARQGRWAPAFKLGPRKSALGNLPEDETTFPTATYLKNMLTQGVQKFVLNSMLIRKASPPGQTRGFKPDGSNLPWVVEGLAK